MRRDPPHDRPVEARGLVKRYGDLAAVDGVDLTVEAGDVYGYLGPNGAGKTTSLRMLLGLIRPTSGERPALRPRSARLRAAGRSRASPGSSRRRSSTPISPAARTSSCSPRTTAATPGGGSTRCSTIVDLADRAGDRVGGYSHGMRQRLGIAASLLRSPRLLLLDEPQTGLDPAGMRDMKALIRGLSSQGITVLLSSHQMADVEELCNRVAIINRGRILYEGDVTGLTRSLGTWYRLRASDLDAAQRVAGEFGLADVAREDGELRFSADEELLERFMITLGQRRIGVRALIPQQATLEQLFFQLTEQDAAPPAPPVLHAVAEEAV